MWLKREKGSIAIEALASLLLLFIAVYSMWGVSILIYNRSKLTSATQLSSQAGIILTNRVRPNNPNIERAVGNILAENVCGMLPSQQTGSGGPPAENTCQTGNPASFLSSVPNASVNVVITCAPDISGNNYNPYNCNTPSQSQAVRVRVVGGIISPFSLIGAAGGRTNQVETITEESEVYSYTKKTAS